MLARPKGSRRGILRRLPSLVLVVALVIGTSSTSDRADGSGTASLVLSGSVSSAKSNRACTADAIYPLRLSATIAPEVGLDTVVDVSLLVEADHSIGLAVLELTTLDAVEILSSTSIDLGIVRAREPRAIPISFRLPPHFAEGAERRFSVEARLSAFLDGHPIHTATVINLLPESAVESSRLLERETGNRGDRVARVARVREVRARRVER